VLDGRDVADAGFDDLLVSILADAPCDVALRVGGLEADLAEDGSFVLVPFGGATHDWAALELGAWAASALGTPLRLLGTEGNPDAQRRDASRLLATAALAVQQLAAVPTTPMLTEPGPLAVVKAAAEAQIVVAGLPDDWRANGLGETRRAIAAKARPPVLVVRRGTRPGGMAPPEGLTRYTWSVTPAG
jgi:hypothetical protein